MTLFGWDASHYDGMLNVDILRRARIEGISFFTHKLGEGIADTEGTYDDTALSAARVVGIPFIGGYYVPRSSTTVGQQVSRCIALADQGEPWWRQFPGWFWQVDLERWDYDSVDSSVGIAFARELRDRTGRWTILYGSHGQYSDSLRDWDGPLWNADYVSRPAGAFPGMYTSDDWKPLHEGNWRGGWAPYSGKEPTFLQYSSSATVAGLTTCDVNAYRGTRAELDALIKGERDMEQSDPLTGYKARGNVGEALADGHNWRDWWYDIPGVTAFCKNPPSEGSRLDIMYRAMSNRGTPLSAEQMAELKAALPTAADIAQEIINRLGNPVR